MMQVWTVVSGHTFPTTSGNPLSQSQTTKKVSLTPRLRYAQPDSNVDIVLLSADREQAHVIGQDFDARLGTIGINTPILLWADESRWADLDTGDMGLRTDAA